MKMTHRNMDEPHIPEHVAEQFTCFFNKKPFPSGVIWWNGIPDLLATPDQTEYILKTQKGANDAHEIGFSDNAFHLVARFLTRC